MKKEQNRYYLVEYATKLTKVYNTREELDIAIDNIRKYNNRKNEEFIVGNMTATLKDNKYYLDFHLYIKLMPKTTISQIDNFTSNYSEKELIVELKDKIKSIYKENTKNNTPYYPDINIAYFEEKNIENNNDYTFRRIKYIPVLYKDDLQYLDTKFISNCINYHAMKKDYKYFEGLIEELKYSHSVSKYLEELEETLREVKYNNLACGNLYYVTNNLYKAYIIERAKDGSILRDNNGSYQCSRRRLRDFGFYTKNYESNKIKRPTMYNYSNNHEKQRELQSILSELEGNKKLVLK